MTKTTNKVCYFFLWIIALFTIPSFAQKTQNTGPSSIQVYESINDSALNSINNPEKLEGLIKQSDSIRKTNNLNTSWKYEIAKAWLYLIKKQYDSVSYIIEKEVLLQKSDSSYDDRGLKLFHLANLNRFLLKYSKANQYYEMLKDISIRDENLDMIYEAYWGMHFIAKSTQDFELAQKYLDELLSITKNDTSLNRFKTYQHYAHNSIRVTDYNTALKYLKLCVNIYDKAPNIIPHATHELSWIYNQMGQICNILVQSHECETYYLKSVELSSSIGYDNITSDSYANLGIFYLSKKEYEEAIKTLNKSLTFLKPGKDDRLRRTVFKYLSATYDSLQDYKSAYNYHKLYAEISDSLNRSEYKDLYVQERTKFNTEQKEKELEVMSANIKTNKIILFAAISLSILIIVIIFLLYRQSRLKSQQKLSQLEKQIAEAKQEYLRKQMNPHFLFNTLNSIQYFMFNNDKIATNDYMSKFAMLIRKTLENSEKSYTSIKDEIDTLNLYIELEQLRFKNKFTYDLNIDPEIDIIQQKIPTMIIHPFVENAINHGLHFLEHGGKLSIKMEHTNDQTIKCTVEDNGIGREKAEKIKSAKHQSMGTSITKERLKILNNRSGDHLKVNFIDLKGDNGEATGTKVTIIIPVI